MRLDEQARRIARMGDAPGVLPAASEASPAALPPPVLVGPPPQDRPRLNEDPGGWARDHWPLLAAGAMVTTVLILSIVAANDWSRTGLAISDAFAS